MIFAPSVIQKPSTLSFILAFMLMMVGVSSQSQAANHPVQPLQSVDLTINSMDVSVGETFEVELLISDVSGLEITAFNLALLYDSTLVSALSASIEGTLSGPGGAEMTLAYNAQSGRMAIAAAGVKAMAGAGNLVVVTFQSLNEGGLATITFDGITINEGSPAAVGTGGSIAIASALPGDATLNGEVSAYDAAKVLRHAAFMDTLTAAPFVAADVSGNHDVTSYDAALILQRVSGLITCFPVEEGCASKNDASKNGEALVDLGWGVAKPDGMVVHLPLLINKMQGDVRAMTIDVRASDDISLASDLKLTLPEGWVGLHHNLNQGTIRILMAGVAPLTSDTLLVLQSGNTALTLDATIQVNEAPAFDLEPFDQQTLPSGFSLMQNYPNPFNPATTIQYALQEDAPVSLIVYDVLGREVARLVDEPQAAGVHAVLFDARALSSGIYVYRLEAGNLSQSRQMMLVK